MKNDELLRLIQQENLENDDPLDLEASRIGWRLGAIFAIVASFVIYCLELIFWDKHNLGLFFVLSLTLAVKFTVSAYKTRTVYHTVMTVVWYILCTLMLILYILYFIYGWV